MTGAVQVRFCGFGGQGVILMGGLLGEAAVREGLWAAGSSSYGAQARGSQCRSDVILSREPADFPHVVEADLLVAMSQQAYELYLPDLHPEGLVIHDHPGAQPRDGETRSHLAFPATAMAVERFGGRQAANVILLAATVSASGLVARTSLSGALARMGVDPNLQDANRAALETGFALGEEARATRGEGLRSWLARLGLTIEDGGRR